MHSKFLQAMVVASLAAAPLAAQAQFFGDSAPGEQKGDWIVRAGFSQVNPEKENLQPILDGTPLVSTLVVDSDVSFTFDITKMFTNHFGVELLAAYPFTHGIDAKPYNGNINTARLGYTDHLPPTLSLVWRPMDDKATLQPYVGAGVNYTMFSGEKLRGDTLSALGLPSQSKLSLDDSVGMAGVVGLDWFPGEAKKWFLNAQARYIQIESDADGPVPAVRRAWRRRQLPEDEARQRRHQPVRVRPAHRPSLRRPGSGASGCPAAAAPAAAAAAAGQVRRRRHGRCLRCRRQVPGHACRHQGRQGRLPVLAGAEGAVRLRQVRAASGVDH